MKNKVLSMLKESDGYISGQEISNILNLSRTAIWKYMNALREDGYIIESASKKGYKLVQSPDILSNAEILPLINTDIIDFNLTHFDSIDSTSKHAKMLASEGAKEGTLVVAEEQLSGRGRLGRSWVSTKSKGIFMSMILRPDIELAKISQITQVAAAAVAKSFHDIGIDASIKWPNDIVINGKKVCGILTEMDAELNKVNYIILGIGVNVNNDSTDFPDELSDIASSCKLEVGHNINRQQLMASILNDFSELYNDFIETHSSDASIKICRKYSAVIGKTVRVIKGSSEELVDVIDIDDSGQLVVKHSDGTISTLFSGEISIRGESSYI